MSHSLVITGLRRPAEQGCHPPEESELPPRRHARHRLRLLQGQGVYLWYELNRQVHVKFLDHCGRHG